MNDVKWPKGYPALYRQLAATRSRILSGTMIALDPSSGGSSLPGFAIFAGGELLTSGEIKLSSRLPIYTRLQLLHEKVSTLTPEPPDVFAIEEIRGQNFSHHHLIYSVGVSMAAARTPCVIEVPINFWRAVAKADPHYFKGNAQDAELIGKSLIMWLREQEDHGKAS